MTSKWLIPSSAIAVAAMAAQAQAQAQKSYPRFTGGVAIEIENDFTFDSDDATAEVNDLFTTTEAAVALEFSASTSINTTILLEPVFDASPNEDRIFEDHGTYAEELYLYHDFGAAAARVGKMDVDFGFAWDIAPGIYGVDFAEDYELTERLGFAVEIPIGFAPGDASLTVAAFMADRTFLSNSLFTNRGDLSENDGGVSNTDAPESFVISLAGETNDFSYNAAIRRQAKGVGDTNDEFGFVAGATTGFGNGAVDVLGEVAFFPNFDGGPDSAALVTLGAAAPVGPVTLSAVYTLREVQNAPADHLATISAEYEIAEGTTVALGYKFSNEARVEAHTVGALLVYEFGF